MEEGMLKYECVVDENFNLRSTYFFEFTYSKNLMYNRITRLCS